MRAAGGAVVECEMWRRGRRPRASRQPPVRHGTFMFIHRSAPVRGPSMESAIVHTRPRTAFVRLVRGVSQHGMLALLPPMQCV